MKGKQAISSSQNFLYLSSHLCLGLPSGLFLSWLSHQNCISIHLLQCMLHVRSTSHSTNNSNNVTYMGLWWLIITGSEFDDWIYWHYFTITVTYNSSHIELLLNDVCLTNAAWRNSHCCLNLGLVSTALNFSLSSNSESESHITTDGQSVSLPWNKAPIWGLRPDIYYCQKVAGLLMWDALSD
jgi:hypothetical protein